eukprot:Hpha_TRINITY_DN26722_c0_g1::TRINITY_DN26722_c0_g1_i1::g.138810::m.138810
MDLHAMPKVELHAHLGGSVRKSTIDELLRGKGLEDLCCTTQEAGPAKAADAEGRMNECFRLFDAIYKVTDKLSVIRRVTMECIEDYAEENCVFLELRTSLKTLEGRPPRDYLNTVLSAVDEANAALGGRAVPTTVLVSVNRGHPPSVAEEAVKLALEFRDRGEGKCRVAGLDFSGNCYKGEWEEFEPHLRRAKEAGLPVSVHAGEKDDDVELDKMIDFGADRIGHLVYAGKRQRQRIREARIPLEFCLTSNIITGNLASAADHHIEKWWGHPVSINTDDRGVFSCTLTSEFELLRSAYKLSDQHMINVAAKAVDQLFLSPEDRTRVRQVFVDFAQKTGLANPYTNPLTPASPSSPDD